MSAERFGVDPLDGAIYDMVHEYRDPMTHKRGVAALSRATGLSESLLQNYSNPNEPSQFTVRQLRTIILQSGDKRALYQLAHDVGEACFPMVLSDFPVDTDVINALADWHGEIAETMQRASGILKDGKVEKSEVDGLTQELIEDFEKGLKLLAVFKGMQEEEK
jgi:hypothetical protein